jgi:hypothetical protein
VLPTLATGIAAWEWQLGGHKLKGMLLLHVALGGVSGLLICLVASLHFGRSEASGSSSPGGYYLALEILTVVVVAFTAHVGGFVSGVNVPG